MALLGAETRERSRLLRTPVGGTAKRLIDLMGALALLTLFAPFMLLLAAIIGFTDPGPIFYRQQRLGFRGRVFSCLKFRSMVVDAEHRLDDYLAQNPGAREEWERDHKLRRDPRVTRIGAFIRKWSLDELPQLLNVLIGDMSMVGPRPITSVEVDRYGSAAEQYFSARPGVTGLWQVSGRNNVAYADRVQMDVTYVTNWSLLSDAAILVRTVRFVFSAEGSH